MSARRNCDRGRVRGEQGAGLQRHPTASRRRSRRSTATRGGAPGIDKTAHLIAHTLILPRTRMAPTCSCRLMAVWSRCYAADSEAAGGRAARQTLLRQSVRLGGCTTPVALRQLMRAPAPRPPPSRCCTESDKSGADRSLPHRAGAAGHLVSRRVRVRGPCVPLRWGETQDLHRVRGLRSEVYD